MPEQPNAIDTHPQRQKIIDAIIAGESMQSIANWCNPRINPVTLWRYKKKKIAPALLKQASAVEVLQQKGLIPKGEGVLDAVQGAARASLQAEPFIARMEKIQAERDEIKGLVKQDKDYRTWAALDRNDITATETHARIAGALSDGPRDSASVRLVVLPVISAPSGPMPVIPGRDVTFRALEAGDNQPEDSKE